MQIYTPPKNSRFIRCKTFNEKINSYAYKSMCMLDCYLLEHALVCYSIALSLSAQGSCLSNKPNLPVTPQSQRRYGDKKGEYGRQLNHGHVDHYIPLLGGCYGKLCKLNGQHTHARNHSATNTYIAGEII